MNLNVNRVCRSVFTFWSVISEVGGLNGVLISVSAFTLSIFSHQKSTNHLVGQLFQMSDPDVSDVNEPQTKESLNGDR